MVVSPNCSEAAPASAEFHVSVLGHLRPVLLLGGDYHYRSCTLRKSDGVTADAQPASRLYRAVHFCRWAARAIRLEGSRLAMAFAVSAHLRRNVDYPAATLSRDA